MVLLMDQAYYGGHFLDPPGDLPPLYKPDCLVLGGGKSHAYAGACEGAFTAGSSKEERCPRLLQLLGMIWGRGNPARVCVCGAGGGGQLNSLPSFKCQPSRGNHGEGNLLQCAGAFTSGRSKEETCTRLQRLLEIYVGGLVRDGAEIPPPSFAGPSDLQMTQEELDRCPIVCTHMCTVEIPA